MTCRILSIHQSCGIYNGIDSTVIGALLFLYINKFYCNLSCLCHGKHAIYALRWLLATSNLYYCIHTYMTGLTEWTVATVLMVTRWLCPVCKIWINSPSSCNRKVNCLSETNDWNPLNFFPAPCCNNLWHTSMILLLIHKTGVFQSKCIECCSMYIETCLHQQVAVSDFAYNYSL